MTTFSNELTPAESERLALLAEECAEVIQVVGKILRHGYSSFNPSDLGRVTNRTLLVREVADVMWTADLMQREGDWNARQLVDARRASDEKKPRYLHHQ